MANRDGVAGGGFNPAADYTTSGNWTMNGDLTVNGTIIDTGSALASPAITGTVTGGASYTAPTLTAPVITGAATIATGSTITAPAIVGATITGTVTVANGSTLTTPVLTTPAINGGTATALINADYKVLAANATYSATVTPATLTGFSWTVVAGTYIFELNLPATMTTNGGLTINFLLTTAVLTSIQYQSYAATASDNTTAVSTNGTTTTSGTKVFDDKTAAYTHVNVKGSMVVGTGGTFAWQGCQNTSAGAGDATIVALGSLAKLTRVA